MCRLGQRLAGCKGAGLAGLEPCTTEVADCKAETAQLHRDGCWPCKRWMRTGSGQASAALGAAAEKEQQQRARRHLKVWVVLLAQPPPLLLDLRVRRGRGVQARLTARHSQGVEVWHSLHEPPPPGRLRPRPLERRRLPVYGVLTSSCEACLLTPITAHGSMVCGGSSSGKPVAWRRALALRAGWLLGCLGRRERGGAGSGQAAGGVSAAARGCPRL